MCGHGHARAAIHAECEAKHGDAKQVSLPTPQCTLEVATLVAAMRHRENVMTFHTAAGKEP